MNPDCNNKIVTYSFLKDYAEGEPSDEKKQKIASWFETPELGFKLESCLKEIWDETDPDKIHPTIGTDLILDRIHHKINIIHAPAVSREKPAQKKPPVTFNAALKYLSRVAAILLLPLMAYAGWELANQGIYIRSQSEVVYNEIICPLGARSRFYLPDGTTGWLNNGSSLKYPVKFMDDHREVALEGEAYFDVSHHKNRPFIIHTNGLSVKVLGTRLNVHAYPDEEYQTFTLEDGSVELIKNERTILTMKPGQHAVYALCSGDQADPGSWDARGNTIIIGDR